MSIAPPTDILFDIARAADPARARTALDKLVGDGSDTSSFITALDTAGSTPSSGSDLGKAQLTASGPVSQIPDKTSPYAKLETFVLQQFVEEILPKDNSFYGTGYASGVWRSMLAEHMARNIVKAGGIGLAKQLEKSRPLPSEDPAA